MGQYFKAVNTTKQEYVSPYDIGGLGKLFEWCANPQAGVFPFLFRKSTGSGGGDVHYHVPEPKYAGRWAGDVVYLVGDYDESGLYSSAEKEYRNISHGLATEYNRFIELPDLQLKPSNI